MHMITPLFADATEVQVLALMIPIVAIIMGMAIPIVVIIADYAKRRKLYELHHKERLAAIDKGMELPPLPIELLGAGPKGRPRYLLRGLIWLFVGLGTLIALSGITSAEAEKTWMLGFIPTGVGLAYLIYYFAEGRRGQQDAVKAREEALRQTH